ncbi:MAG: hypothetical protein AAB617_01800 [Patescibacteria group bacterium]
MNINLKLFKLGMASKRQLLFFGLAAVMIALVTFFIFYDLSFLIGKFNIVLREETPPVVPAAFDIDGFQALHLIK